MFKVFRYILQLKSKNVCNTAFLSCNNKLQKAITQERYRTKNTKIGSIGWILLIIPGASFVLGTWQVQRKKWKENLIAELKLCSNAIPIELPSLEEIAELQYRPIRVRGQFLHDKEIYLGPRTLLHNGEPVSSSALISKRQRASQGYLVITPFKLSDREKTILVNRGWVPMNNKNPNSRLSGQIQGEVDLIGILRQHENRAPFMSANNPVKKIWIYRDLEQMCEVTGAEPIFLDATDEFDVEGGPIGGQTRITLRNEHLSYILTWYSLSAITSFMWYSQFIKGVSL